MSKVMYAGLVDFQCENKLVYFKTATETTPQYADELVMFMVRDGQSVLEALGEFIAANKPECERKWKKTLFPSFTSEEPPLLASAMH